MIYIKNKIFPFAAIEQCIEGPTTTENKNMKIHQKFQIWKKNLLLCIYTTGCSVQYS